MKPDDDIEEEAKIDDYQEPPDEELLKKLEKLSIIHGNNQEGEFVKIMGDYQEIEKLKNVVGGGDYRDCSKNFKNTLNGDDQDFDYQETQKLKDLDVGDNQDCLKNVKNAINGDDQDSDYQEIQKLKNLGVVGDNEDCLKNFKNALDGDKKLKGTSDNDDSDDAKWLKEFMKLAIHGSDPEEVLLKNVKEIGDGDDQENAMTKNVGLCDPGPVPDASELAALVSEIDESFLENILQDLSNLLEMDNLSTDLPTRKD